MSILSVTLTIQIRIPVIQWQVLAQSHHSGILSYTNLLLTEVVILFPSHVEVYRM